MSAHQRAERLEQALAEANETIRTLRGDLYAERATNKVLEADVARLEREVDQQTRFKYAANERADRAEAELARPDEASQQVLDGSFIVTREFIERCRPAAKSWWTRAEGAVMSKALPAHYKPALEAEAARAAALLDEIDAMLKSRDTYNELPKEKS